MIRPCLKIALVLTAWLAAAAWGTLAADDSDLPPVPGFGERETVPGFGKVETLEDLYEQRVIDYVDGRMLGRYDTNKNGQLDPEEFGRVHWGDSPKQDDKDGDGRLSREELAGRAVRRWGYGKKPPNKNATVPGFGVEYDKAPSRSSASLERLYETKVLDYVDQRILRYYDKNRNRILEPDEITKVRWADDWKQDDKDGDGRLTRGELAGRMARRWNWGKKSTGHSSSTPQKSPESKRVVSGKEDDRKSYRFRTAAERLPEGLPDWFAEKDADGDGQVSMSEFSSKWTDAAAEEFCRHDRNGDGVITAREAMPERSK